MERQRLRGGASVWLIALAVVAGVATTLIFTALQGRPGVRGYAELYATHRGCSLTGNRRDNAIRCTYISPGVYEVTFARDLGDSAPIATLGACCPGTIGVSLKSDRIVTVAIRPENGYPVTAQIVVP